MKYLAKLVVFFVTTKKMMLIIVIGAIKRINNFFLV